MILITITVMFSSAVRGRVRKHSTEFTTDKTVLRDVLEEILNSYEIRDLMLTEDGIVRPWAPVLVNRRNHELVGGLDAKVKDGDRIPLIYPFIESL